MKAGQSSTQKPDCNEQDTRNGAEKALTSAVSRKAKAEKKRPVRQSVSECEFNTNAALTDVGRK